VTSTRQSNERSSVFAVGGGLHGAAARERVSSFGREVETRDRSEWKAPSGSPSAVSQKSVVAGMVAIWSGEFVPTQNSTIILVHKDPTRYRTCTFGHG